MNGRQGHVTLFPWAVEETFEDEREFLVSEARRNQD
jgi:hypothetical protein